MTTYVFIDASNLFYGGEKSLGWKIDYRKLLKYLKKRYQAKKVYYFGGIEIHEYPYNYLTNDTVPVEKVLAHIEAYIKMNKKRLHEVKLTLLSRHVDRIRFYRKLRSFGYQLLLKPVKMYTRPDGSTERKANCDVDMAFYLMKEQGKFDRVLILSGDGDFLPVLKYLRKCGKEVIVLARGRRTAREIRQFAGSRFTDFDYLKMLLRMKEKDK